jgi:alkyl sulfatase BDS1-like metallo-beta-lactamase superfamily hydrolase
MKIRLPSTEQHSWEKRGFKPNKAVNADAFFVRFAHYKCAGYGWR